MSDCEWMGGRAGGWARGRAGGRMRSREGHKGDRVGLPRCNAEHGTGHAEWWAVGVAGASRHSRAQQAQRGGAHLTPSVPRDCSRKRRMRMPQVIPITVPAGGTAQCSTAWRTVVKGESRTPLAVLTSQRRQGCRRHERQLAAQLMSIGGCSSNIASPTYLRNVFESF